MRLRYQVILVANILAASTTLARPSRLHQCSSLLEAAFTRMHGSPDQFELWVAEQTKIIRSRIRTPSEISIDPANARTAIRRALGAEWDVSTEHFTQRHSMDEFAWKRLVRNLEQMRNFFHNHVEYSSFTPESFIAKFKIFDDGSGKLNPVYFENIAMQTLTTLSERLEYAHLGLQTLKKAHKADKTAVPQALIDKSALEIAISITHLRSAMPKLGAIVFQLYRLDQMAHGTFELPDVNLVDREHFNRHILRNGSLQRVVHDFFRLENAINRYHSITETRRAFTAIETNPKLLESY